MNPENQTAALQEEIAALKKQLAEYKQMVKDLSVPIIPSILPETILVPISGKLSADRFETIISVLLDECYKRSVETVIIDFTAITRLESDESAVLGQSLDRLVESLRLMGAETFLVGFSPSLTQAMVQTGLRTDQQLHTFLTFRNALQFLMKKKGLTFASFK